MSIIIPIYFSIFIVILLHLKAKFFLSISYDQANTKVAPKSFTLTLKVYMYEAFWDMIVAFFQQGQNGPDLG